MAKSAEKQESKEKKSRKAVKELLAVPEAVPAFVAGLASDAGGDEADAELATALFQKLTAKDLKNAAENLDKEEARYLVDFYYQTQKFRIQSAAQVRGSKKDVALGTESETPAIDIGEELDSPEEPNGMLSFVFGEFLLIEKRIKKALDYYTDTVPVCGWLKSIHGVGPVIAAGLISHIDITKAPTTSHIWRFAGLDPSQVWETGKKRPWNAKLKVLVAFKMGESFVKFQNNEKCYYGHMFAERKALERARNERGDFAEQASAQLAKKKIGKDTDAYKAYIEGKLPPAHIHARARRYAAKMTLSHLQMVWYWMEFGELPPKPYAMTHLGHGDFLPPPHLDKVPGLKEAILKQYHAVNFPPM